MEHRWRAWAVAAALAFVLGWLASPPGAARAAPDGYLVIVHPSNPISTVDRRFLGRLFLKRATRWPNGDMVLPVDLPADSPARESFVREVLERSLEAVKSYWQQQIFSGQKVPPPELDSNEAVVRYVARHRGAIGYVGAGGDLHFRGEVAAVKVISVE